MHWIHINHFKISKIKKTCIRMLNVRSGAQRQVSSSTSKLLHFLSLSTNNLCWAKKGEIGSKPIMVIGIEWWKLVLRAIHFKHTTKIININVVGSFPYVIDDQTVLWNLKQSKSTRGFICSYGQQKQNQDKSLES